MKSISQTATRPDQVLSSWKDIANYLRREVRTVQRWERSRGLPVHRLPGRGRNAIYAVQSEIDAWWASSPARQEAPQVVPLAATRRPRRTSVLVAAALTGLIGMSMWLAMRRALPPAPLPVTPLTSLPGAELYPTLSPDGKRLVFTWKREDDDNFDLYLMNTLDGKPERLTSDPALDLLAEWSPDGGAIAYYRIPRGSDRTEVRLVDMRTREDRLLFATPVGAAAVDPPPWGMTWTRDGRALVLPTPREGGTTYGLSRWDLATGAMTPLTTPTSDLTGDLTPAFSPDGRSLVFHRRPVSGSGYLYRLDLAPDGTPAGEPRQLTREPCCQSSPSWTRDGREIVFLSTQNDVPRLMRVSANGGTPHPDLSVPAPGAGPRLAPNGWLVYSRDSARVASIVSVDLDDGRAVGKPHRLIASSRQEREPAFSPDGSRIAFSSDRGGTRQIWLCDRGGASARQLTNLEGISAVAPSWSPSAQWIAFEGETGNGSGIYLTSTSGGRPWPVAVEGPHNRMPRWSRNGRSLYFASDRSGRFETWRVELDADGKPVRTGQITRQGGFSGVESADGRFVYYSKEFTMRSLWRVPAAGGKEEPVLGNVPLSRNPANVTAGRSGLYFRGQAGKNGTPLWFLPFDGPPAPRQVMTELALPHPGIAVSPDDRQLLLTVYTQASGDIVAVRGFR